MHDAASENPDTRDTRLCFRPISLLSPKIGFTMSMERLDQFVSDDRLTVMPAASSLKSQNLQNRPTPIDEHIPAPGQRIVTTVVLHPGTIIRRTTFACRSDTSKARHLLAASRSASRPPKPQHHAVPELKLDIPTRRQVRRLNLDKCRLPQLAPPVEQRSLADAMEAAELCLATLVEIEIIEKCSPLLGARDTVLVLPAIRPSPSTKVSVEKRAHRVILESTGYRCVPVCPVTLHLLQGLGVGRSRQHSAWILPWGSGREGPVDSHQTVVEPYGAGNVTQVCNRLILRSSYNPRLETAQPSQDMLTFDRCFIETARNVSLGGTEP